MRVDATLPTLFSSKKPIVKLTRCKIMIPTESCQSVFPFTAFHRTTLKNQSYIYTLSLSMKEGEIKDNIFIKKNKLYKIKLYIEVYFNYLKHIIPNTIYFSLYSFLFPMFFYVSSLSTNLVFI